MSEKQERASILIVDDEESVGLGMSELLSDVGFEATYVLNGRDALKAVESQDFKLIFMDIIMPGMNGLETYREISRICPDTTVILFTGYFRDAEDVILKGVKEGMVDEFIRKPYFADEIIRSVQKYCS
ncbi:MAG: response regulator [Thermodesulfobacteriota bacterium]